MPPYCCFHYLHLPRNLNYVGDAFQYIDEHIDRLTTQCVTELQSQGFPLDSITTTPYLNMRYDKTDCAIMCTAAAASTGSTSCRHGDFLSSFNERPVTVCV